MSPFEMPTVNRLDAQVPEWLATANMETMAGQGRALYQRYQCEGCHELGENPKRLDNLHERLGYAAVIEVLTAPPSPMPLFPLTQSEQRELAVFLLWQPHLSPDDEHLFSVPL